VVIVFDDAKGIAPKHDDAGAIVYEIPRNGVLRLSTPAPEPGIYHVIYLYVHADGTRQKLPNNVDKGVLQIFADVTGATDEGGNGKAIHWEAYVVGVPGDRNDWTRMRGDATSRAIGVSGSL
jgi:hypothetical protein